MPSPFLEKICPSGFSLDSQQLSPDRSIGGNSLLAGASIRGRILCFLGGKLKVAVLYLGSYPVCQGRVAGFFGFLPVFSGNWYMYFGVIGEMMCRWSLENTRDCGVDADGAKL